MGYHFQVKHANLVAYITSSIRPTVPRATAFELVEFLAALSGRFGDHRPLISSDKHWLEEVNSVAAKAYQEMNERREQSDALVPESVVREVLAPLVPLLSNYKLFCLPVGSWRDTEERDAFLRHAAFSSGHDAMILMPDDPRGVGDLNVLDPFPAVSCLAEQAASAPGVLFWSRSGNATFAELPYAIELFETLRRALHHGRRVDDIIDECQARREDKRLLHLSDVHFGTEAAMTNQAYLLTHLQGIKDRVSRVAITGDLFNQPDRRMAIEFQNFRLALGRQRRDDCIVIPGNHDQKWLGNFRSDLGPLANLEWSNVVVDDEIQTVFFCFDSSRDADWARGKITPQQMRDVATVYDTQALHRPEIREYLHVALIHHHPFSFETEKETIIAKMLSHLRITDELFLRMDDADQFLRWCAQRGVRLILHGHKHVPRYVTKHIELPDHGWSEITSIGCGTSLGIEGKPMSYNLIGWNPASQKWTVSFFADSDGGGFTKQFVSVHSMS